MRDFYHLIKKIGIQRKYIFLLILRSPFDAARTWMLAGLMKHTFLCLEHNDVSTLLEVCISYGLICALLFFYNERVWSIYAAFSAKAEAKLEKLMLDKILSLPFKQIDSHFSGEWMTKLNSDIRAAYSMMNEPFNIPHVAVSIINTILSSFLMLRSSFLFFAITWVWMLPHLYLNYRIVLRHLPKLKEAAQNYMAANTSAMKPLITEADTILLYDAGGLLMKNCEESSRNLMQLNLNMHMRRTVSNAFFHLFGCGGYLAILIIGFWFIWGGKMGFSDVVYCFQVRGSIMAGMTMLITCLNNIKANSVCIKRIHNI